MKEQPDGDTNGWRLRKKGSRSGGYKAPQAGGVGITLSGTNMYLLGELTDAMGDPEAIRFKINGNKIALIPAEADDPNSYSLSGNNQVTGNWIKSETPGDTLPQGRYDATRRGDMWIVDFDNHNADD